MWSDAVIVGLISAVPSTIAAIAAYRSHLTTKRLRVEVDGRLTALLTSVGGEQREIGRGEGVEAERVRHEAV